MRRGEAEQDAAPAGGETNAPPLLPGGDGAPPGDTKTPRQELADSGPRHRCVVAESAARRRKDAAMARREAPHRLHKRRCAFETDDALIGAPFPLCLERDGKDRPPRAATKNRGGGALSSFRGAAPASEPGIQTQMPRSPSGFRVHARTRVPRNDSEKRVRPSPSRRQSASASPAPRSSPAAPRRAKRGSAHRDRACRPSA
jgi:hypothetical protein